MTSIAILWDAAHLWGLLVRQALEAFGLPYRMFKAQDIAHGALSDKTSLLIVPGGPARNKSEALGKSGRRAIQEWVKSGGQYLGFCGGAGLGLSDVPGDRLTREGNGIAGMLSDGVPGGTGLGLCPWHRAVITERMQHLVSGHVQVSLHGEHPLIPEWLTDRTASSPVSLPVWWPGRFEPSQSDSNTDGITVLARYAEENPCQSALWVGDLPLASLSESVLSQWQDMYGVSLAPDFLHAHPCVLHGVRGRGGYTLSYSHLETPASPDANRWLAHIIHVLTGLAPHQNIVPQWNPHAEPVIWSDPVLTAARSGIASLLRLGREHGLLFDRTSWLTGWRAGIPGSGLNNLHLALCVLSATPPSPEGETLWKHSSFERDFAIFQQGVEGLLLAERLAAIAPESVPRASLSEQHRALFGSAMRSGGLYKTLMATLNEVLFVNLQQACPVTSQTRQISVSQSASEPCLVFFSGGTAFGTTAAALSRHTANAVHIITTFDSGGSSAVLRQAFTMPAVGDIRARLMSLAETGDGNAEMIALFRYRLPLSANPTALRHELHELVTGQHPLIRVVPPSLREVAIAYLSRFASAMPADIDLRGACLGNLILTAGYLEHHRQLEPVIDLFARLLRIRGIVKPVSTDTADLCVELENGQRILGQHAFTGKTGTPITSPIKSMWLAASLSDPSPVQADMTPDLEEIIRNTSLICYPVGSFYSSILANLLPNGVREAIREARCPKVFLPNLGVDPELFGRTMLDQLRILLADTSPASGILTDLLVDTDPARYPDGIPHVFCDQHHIRIHAVPLVSSGSYLDPDLASAALLNLLTEKNIEKRRD